MAHPDKAGGISSARLDDLRREFIEQNALNVSSLDIRGDRYRFLYHEKRMSYIPFSW